MNHATHQWLLIYFKATAYYAIVAGEYFHTSGANTVTYARATEVMNTKSPFDFRWSIRVTGGRWIYIGIASKLQRKNTSIGDYDKNAILFSPRDWTVSKGSQTIQTGIAKSKYEGEIHFRFQPKLKKFSLSLVCLLYILNLFCSLAMLNFRKMKNILSISKKP